MEGIILTVYGMAIAGFFAGNDIEQDIVLNGIDGICTHAQIFSYKIVILTQDLHRRWTMFQR